MKFLKTTAIIALAVMAASCHNEGLRIEGNGSASYGQGYLSLAGLSVECVEDYQAADKNIEEEKSQLSVETRAAVDINTFDCSIINSQSEVVATYKYGNLPTEPITLDAGKYIFRIMSGEVAPAAWESPVYGIEQPFTINRKETTKLEDLVCTLQNIQVSVSFSADLRQMLSDTTTTTISVGENSLVYGIDETQSGYFMAVNESNTIEVLVKGLYTPEGKTEAAEFEMTASIDNVKAGQHSDINFYVEYSGEGSINIGATIDGWVVDELLAYEFSSAIVEDVIIEASQLPTIVLVDGDIDATLPLLASDFDDRGNCTKDVVVDIAAVGENTIASLVVEISSNNSELISSLSSFNIPTTFDMCNAGDAAMALRLLGLKVNENVLGQPSVSYTLTGQMDELFAFAGTHSFKVTVTDNKGNSNTKTLAIAVDGDVEDPALIWEGYDFSVRHNITAGFKADFLITSTSGIADLVVEIHSEAMGTSALDGVKLCNQLNLCYPEQSKWIEAIYEPDFDPASVDFDSSTVAPALTKLGLPSGDEVIGKKELPLSITYFLSMLTALGEGAHDFIFTITDAEGNVTNKTIMLYTPAAE
ncbi:MAG: DUF4493 domain-containing protein [Alistipes sp.]|nr:DUF4493 domain-containing protein [Alistipes sp.]